MAKKSKPKKNKVGRPSKYKPEYCQAIIDFFDVEPYEEREIEHMDKRGNVTWVDIKRMANPLPTLRNFAKHIGCGVSTLMDWVDPKHASYHPEFSEAYKRAKRIRKWFLVENGLNGCHNPLYAKFVAVNMTDMSDKQQVEHQGVVVMKPDGISKSKEAGARQADDE